MSVIKLAFYPSQIFCKKPLSFNKFIISRAIKSTSETCQKASKTSNEWETIYKFPHIQSFVSASKLKIYQTALTAITVPASLALPELVDPSIVATLGISGIVTLSIASYAFRNTVGLIYTSQSQPEKVKFSYLDFWGNRKDVEMNINDVKPFSELPRSVFDKFFTTLQFYSGHHKLKLFYKVGGVINGEELSRIFSIEQL